MTTKEKISMIENWVRTHYERDDIYVHAADPRCGKKYGLVVMQSNCIAYHISDYKPINELMAFAEGTISADVNRKSLNQITKQ